MNSMPIDLATVDWLYVIVLALFVFLATLIASVLSFGRRFMGALLSAILFARLPLPSGGPEGVAAFLADVLLIAGTAMAVLAVLLAVVNQISPAPAPTDQSPESGTR